MSRDPKLYMEDILLSCHRVKVLRERLKIEDLEDDWVSRDAVLRNLEIIGEAVNRLPESLKASEPSVPWRSIAGFRNILAHAYFNVDDDLVWDVMTTHIDPLEKAVQQIMQKLGE